ncbi:MAG: sigma-70 family RNA polymerase sigma factor [Armatimonadetes bacterium]|nr:sigma-70 family RNA polymerase sigma factor [Armatimonadota bacterium]MBS1727880.1 sigma-70 family RNA polymerase sigma factor [Armatimonadota bacterium]
MLSWVKNRTGTLDRSANFERLMRDSYRQAFSVAFRLTGDAADAEDLLQEAYIRAFRFFHRYDEKLPFNSWMYRIIANAHIDLIRRRGKLKTSSLDHSGSDGQQAFEIADHSNVPGDELVNSSFSEIVQTGLNKMNPEFRLAVILADIEGLSYEEVAEIMETSVGTVRSRIHRGRVQLRTFLLDNAPESYGRYAHVL